MKLPALFIILFAISANLSGQTDTSSVGTKTDLSKMVTQKDIYLQKSKNQKTTAFVFLGVGTATLVTGCIMMGTAKNNTLPVPFPTDEKTYDGAGLILLGALVDLASIPFFVSSSKNKAKAMSVSIKNELIPVEMVAQVKQYTIPALSFKWAF
jgi:hypothetical protein